MSRIFDIIDHVMEFILDILFDLIIQGSIEAAGDKKVPMALRVLAAVILIVVFGGVVALCAFIGITERNWIVLAIGAVIAVLITFAIVSTVKRHRS